jgi:putative PIN family toxin of toxin-antitoxin system
MGSVTKVVIDSNVFISAFGWDGKPEAVLRLVEQGRLINYTTEAIFDELMRVVAYPKLKFPQSLQIKILEFVFFWSRFVRREENIAVVTDDPKDDMFIECAISAGANFIISGDPHLLALGSYRNVKIVSPAEFLEIR